MSAKAIKFYNWWQNTVKGDYIPDENFDLVLERFETKEKPDNKHLKIIK